MNPNEPIAANPSNIGFARLARGLIRSMRPRQWTKNLVVFAALIFDEKLLQRGPLIASLIGFAVLCMLSSAVYLINDAVDVKADRQHPKKRNRPIARGDVPIPIAIAYAAILIVIGLAVAFATKTNFGWISAGYLALTSLYSFKLKHEVVLDVLIVSIGFVLRVASGTVLVDAVRFSPWLYICMSLLALLLGFGKRRQELVELGPQSTTRAILKHYSVPMLDQVTSIVTGSLVVSYMMYTFFAPQLPANHSMMLTIPFVLYGLFRYFYLVYVRGEGGAPDEMALKDRRLQITIGLWILVAIAVLYLNK